MKKFGLSAILISMLLVSGCAISEKKMDTPMDNQMGHETEEKMMDGDKMMNEDKMMMDKKDDMKDDMKMDSIEMNGM